MKKVLFAVSLLLSIPQVSTLHAEDAATAKLRQTLAERFPDIKIDSVTASALPGLYEIVTPSEILYIDAAAEHLIFGQIVDAKTHENLTQQRWDEINHIDFNTLPFKQAIKTVKGDGRRKLAMFADPFCPFCQELEQTLKTIDNVTLYVFLYPLEDLHPGAGEAARRIWCAPDRAATWTTWMLDQKAPQKSDCTDTPIAELGKLGERLKINSTPTLIFEDGTRVPGAIDAEKLEKKLAATELAASGKQTARK